MIELPKSLTETIEDDFAIAEALGIDDIDSIREVMRANYSAPEGFPPVVRKGSYAYVTFDGGEVLRCPAFDGSDDFALNAFAWLKMLWPFRVTSSGKLVKTVRRLDGRESNLQLHDLYAHFAHQHLEFDFRNLEAVNGDWLDWSPDNIRPVKDPDEPASAKEKKKAALSDDAVREFEKFIRVTPLLPDEKRTALSKDFIRWHQRTVADLKQAAVDAKRFEEHQEFELPYPEFVADPKGSPPPARPSNTDSTSFDENGEEGCVPLLEEDAPDQTAASSTKYDDLPLEPLFKPHVHAALDYYDLTRDEFRTSLPSECSTDHALGTELVLNFYGWQTPRNGRLPTYEGRLSVIPWPRTVIRSQLVAIRHKLLILKHLLLNQIEIPQLAQISRGEE